MLVIRLFRVGKKNQPVFKIVVTDKRRPPKGGRFLEQVGFYNPLTKEKNLKEERIKYWMSVGAKPSATVYNLLIQEKIVDGKKIPVHKKAKKKPSAAKAPESKEEKKEEKIKDKVEEEKPIPIETSADKEEKPSSEVKEETKEEKPSEAKEEKEEKKEKKRIPEKLSQKISIKEEKLEPLKEKE